MSCCKKGRSVFPITKLGGLSSGGGIDVKVRGEHPIESIETITVSLKDYLIKFNQHIALEGSLTLSSIVTNPSDAKNGTLAYRGAIVEDVNLSWEFTKSGSSVDVNQIIQWNSIDNQITPTTLKSTIIEDVNLEYNDSQSLRTFKLIGNDGTGNPNGIIERTVVVPFGAKVFMGEGVLITDDGDLKVFIESLDFIIRQNKNNISFNPISNNPNNLVYIATPSDFGNISFRDTTSPIAIDPLQLYRSNFTIDSGLIEESYNIYISSQGALSGSNIVSI